MNLNIYDNIVINKSLIRLIGIEASVYWAELMEILPRVFSKKTYNEEGYFPLNRNYITDQIGMDLITQYNCDAILNNIGVLEFNLEDRNQIRVSPMEMNRIIIAEQDEKKSWIIQAAKLSSEMKKLNKEQATKYMKEIKVKEKEEEKAKRKVEHDTKTTAIVEMFKNYIAGLVQDEEILDLMQSWVDSVYARGLFLTKQVILLFWNDLNAYACGNRAVMIKITQIAVKTGYRDFGYVKSYFERNTENSKLGGVSTDTQPTANSITNSDLVSF